MLRRFPIPQKLVGRWENHAVNVWFQHFCTLAAKKKLLRKVLAVYVRACVKLHILGVSAEWENMKSQTREGTVPTLTSVLGKPPARGKEAK